MLATLGPVSEHEHDQGQDRPGDTVEDYYRRAAEQARAGQDRAREDRDDRWGASRYRSDDLAEIDSPATGQSMGCGNPAVLAGLQPGEIVLDLGAGAGLDVLLAARRVGPAGRAYGVDFLPEMVDLARTNATEAGIANAEFLEGRIEAVPLPEASIDVVISNCVINLAPDKAPVFAEMARVLRPGGRIAVSDVVGDDDYVAPESGEAWSECGAGGLPSDRYQAMLAASGLVDITIEFTHDVAPGLHGAEVRARRPDAD